MHNEFCNHPTITQKYSEYNKNLRLHFISQIALIDLLTALEIIPNGMIGHSVGELACAYADGCFTSEQMILVAYYRGVISKQTEVVHGTMAAVGK